MWKEWERNMEENRKENMYERGKRKKKEGEELKPEKIIPCSRYTISMKV